MSFNSSYRNRKPPPPGKSRFIRGGRVMLALQRLRGGEWMPGGAVAEATFLAAEMYAEAWVDYYLPSKTSPKHYRFGKSDVELSFDAERQTWTDSRGADELQPSDALLGFLIWQGLCRKMPEAPIDVAPESQPMVANSEDVVPPRRIGRMKRRPAFGIVSAQTSLAQGQQSVLAKEDAADRLMENLQPPLMRQDLKVQTPDGTKYSIPITPEMWLRHHEKILESYRKMPIKNADLLNFHPLPSVPLTRPAELDAKPKESPDAPTRYNTSNMPDDMIAGALYRSATTQAISIYDLVRHVTGDEALTYMGSKYVNARTHIHHRTAALKERFRRENKELQAHRGPARVASRADGREGARANMLHYRLLPAVKQ